MELIKIKRNDLQRGYEMKEVDNHDDRNAFFFILNDNEPVVHDVHVLWR